MSDEFRKYLEEEKEKSEKDGIAKGIAQGMMDTLVALVKEGSISIAVAARKAGMSEKDFCAQAML